MLEREVSHLFARPVVSIVHWGGGGNSRIFKVQDTDGRFYALKSYPSLALDSRDRLGSEYAALDFLSRNGNFRVPRPVSMDREKLLAVYEWIDGSRPAPSETVIDAMLEFIRMAYFLRENPEAKQISLASECCLSGADILRQVRNRLDRLKLHSEETELQKFLAEAVEPMLASMEFPDMRLPDTLRCLNPGDFGAHNMLLRGEVIAFVDMEYFGWDDPVKQVCDVIWHPGMGLTDDLAQRFLVGARLVYGLADVGFAERVRNFFPAYGLRWTMILLNEFLPERWALRAHAGAENHSQAKARQLAKARALIQSISGRLVMVRDILK